ncbi:PhoH family protein, partial [Methylobacterium tarhaniae]|uniref:PhoH family protein n=1 Tax=Methylobacterium tarhaniae TaxID=1187852 RepID=UPI003D062104
RARLAAGAPRLRRARRALPSQIDLPPGQKSGLVEAVRILDGVEGIGRVTFRDVDVVRHDLVRRIVTAYESDAQENRDEPPQRPTPSRRGPLP